MSSKKSRKRIVHDPEVLKAAMDDVKIKGFSMRKAAKFHNIPLTTLHDKLTGKRPIVPNRSLLTIGEEKRLVKWLLELFKCGFRKSNEEIRETARAIIAARDNSSESQEQVELPTRQWLNGFYSRHPELPSITTIDLRRKKEIISPSAVELWFKKFQATITSIDLTIFSSPSRIFNADEMGFDFDMKSNNVKACKGSKHSYYNACNAQAQVTVLTCCNAAGQYIPPLLIYPFKDTPRHSLLENFPEAFLQLSDNGLITSAFFSYWLKHIFIPSTNHLPKPILLLVDAHISHTSFLEISPICSQNNIILYCLLPHASDIIQPLNQAFLSNFKPAWSDALKQHVANTGKGVNLESFAGVLKSVWNKVTTPEIASDSFKAAGIFPLNPSKVIKSKKRWLKQAYSSKATEDDIPKSPCTFQVPSEAFTSSEAHESASPELQQSSTTPFPPESITFPDPTEFSTPCLPFKFEATCETSAYNATSQLTSTYIFSLDGSTSLASHEVTASPSPISAPTSYNDEQIDALKEHSYFIFEEMTKTELSMFFSRLAHSGNQIFPDSLREEKFQQFKTLTHAIAQAFKVPEDPSHKTAQDQDKIFIVPTLEENELEENLSPETTSTLPSTLNGRHASKEKLSDKEKKKTHTFHDIEVLKAAIEDVKTKGLSIRKAAKLHKIPLTTLHDKLTGKQPLVPRRSLLTQGEENRLVKWLNELFKCGFRKSNEEVRETARAIIAARNSNSGSQDEIELPTREWLIGFVTRHPELSLATPMSIVTKSPLVSLSAVELWFNKFRETLNSIDPSILSSPNRVFNADEMGFQFDTKSNNVKACKGSKNVNEFQTSNKTQVTVLACCNAAGQYIPPLLIYPCKETPTHNLLEHFPEALLQLSDNGLITSAFFFSWLKHIFIPSTKQLPKPILLLVDDHISHTSFLEISPICSQNNIILYCLLPHASDIIQPLNQTFLGTFKPAWSDALKQHVANTGKGVKLESFAGVLKSVWNKVATPEIASDSFRAAGIFPFNPSKIISNEKLWLKQACSSEATGDGTPKLPKATQDQDNILIVPTLVEKGQIEISSHVATATLPSGEELRLALKRKLSERDELGKKGLAKTLRDNEEKREEKRHRRLFKELRKIEKKKRKKEREKEEVKGRLIQ
uniref:HTH CENPB-type domain-containing protein n=1 Tax=Biomphalaria glabrata TaxID=6526 RepID=A0A2C9KBT1_BIOGL